MNSDLMKRLFRAIADNGTPELRAVANDVLKAERDLGHANLARQLEGFLNEQQNIPQTTKVERPAGLLSPLGTNGDRKTSGLVARVERERLRHHMVLPPNVEHRFQRIEQEYASRKVLAKYGLRPRKRVLLYGPSGCGKSLGAERLAWYAGLPMLKVRFDVIMSPLFGESAANLRHVFELSIKQPCLLFLDECDFVARSRMNTNDVGEMPRIVNTLLQLLEDYEAPGLLVAATNLTHSLDQALFRRFDDVFEVPRPGQQEIVRLLQSTLSPISVSDQMDYIAVADKMQGMSASEVVRVAQDAAKIAVLSFSLPVATQHISQILNESGPSSSILEDR